MPIQGGFTSPADAAPEPPLSHSGERTNERALEPARRASSRHGCRNNDPTDGSANSSEMMRPINIDRISAIEHALSSAQRWLASMNPTSIVANKICFIHSSRNVNLAPEMGGHERTFEKRRTRGREENNSLSLSLSLTCPRLSFLSLGLFAEKDTGPFLINAALEAAEEVVSLQS